MKKIMNFVFLISIMVVGISAHAQEEWMEGHEWLPVYSFDWENGEEPTSSHEIYSLRGKAIGAETFAFVNLRYEDGVMDFFNTHESRVTEPHMLPEKPRDFINTFDGRLWGVSASGVYDAETGDIMAPILLYNEGGSGGYNADYDPVYDRFYIESLDMGGMLVLDYSSMTVVDFYPWAEFPGGMTSLMDINCLPDGTVLLAGTPYLAALDPETGSITSYSNAPTASYSGMTEIFTGGVMYVGGDFAGQGGKIRFVNGVYDGTFYPVDGRINEMSDGRLVLSGSGTQALGIGLWEFNPEWPELVRPVVDEYSNTIASNVSVIVVDDEIWLYNADGPNVNATGIMGHYGYEVVRFTTDELVSIEDPKSQIEVGFYPNPATSTVTITGVPFGTPIDVYNTFGQKVTIESIASDTYDISHLPKGVYYILGKALVVI